jgi:CTP synthase (UTP-ammonia lyase)
MPLAANQDMQNTSEKIAKNKICMIAFGGRIGKIESFFLFNACREKEAGVREVILLLLVVFRYPYLKCIERYLQKASQALASLSSP